MNDQVTDNALALTLWARVWSPITDETERAEAWQALGLPGVYSDIATDYWSTFHVGSPQPMAPLMLSVMLGKESSSAREDWLRVVNYLGLEWDDVYLSPDQLGVACEIMAVAVAREESVLIKELHGRYLAPWCLAAQGIVVEGELKAAVDAFSGCVASLVP